MYFTKREEKGPGAAPEIRKGHNLGWSFGVDTHATFSLFMEFRL